MVANNAWINLPVGYNLEDHTNTDTVVSHPGVEFYDFYQAWDSPVATDRDLYMNNRSGILAQAAPNIGPMFWEEITGADGIVRQIQWQARVEGAMNVPNGKALTISQYLGRGATSRGRMGITSDLNTVVSEVPYLHDKNDREVIIKSLENLQEAMAKVPGLVWNFPPANQTARDYIETMVVSTGNRRANHWIGSNKMGLDDGTKANGTAVVDTNTKVYGTDNLFVVDASIFPGMVSTNPSALIVIASEKAAEKILALK
jgi:cellobiose dehydrogenase (acceptor)